MTTPQSIVIVGASLAGAKAAETLREEGYDGRLVLVGQEPERPYERPPLSKDYLRGEVGREKVYVHDAGFYDEQAIELRTGRTATAVDLAERTVTLAGGERLRLGPSAPRHRRRAAPAEAAGDGPRRRPVPARPGRLRPPPGALASGGRLVGGRRRLDRLGGRRLGAPARRGGDRAGAARRAAGERARAGDRAGSTRPPPRARGGAADRRRVWRRSRAPVAWSASAWLTAARSTARPWSSGSASPRARRSPRPRGSRWTTASSWTPPCARACRRRLRGRRHRQRDAPLLRPARARRALGQRAQPGPGGGAQHARSRGALRPHPVLLLRPVRRRDGVLGPRRAAPTGWSCGVTWPAAS